MFMKFINRNENFKKKKYILTCMFIWGVRTGVDQWRKSPPLLVFRVILCGKYMGCGCGMLGFEPCSFKFNILSFLYSPAVPCVLIVFRFKKLKNFIEYLSSCPHSHMLCIYKTEACFWIWTPYIVAILYRKLEKIRFL